MTKPAASHPGSLRQRLTRHAVGFGLLGPPLGWLIAGLAINPDKSDLSTALLVFLIGLPFSYIAGAVPAIVTGLASALLSKFEAPPYLLGAVAVGAMTSAVFPGIWLSHGIVRVETLWDEALIGAAAAFGCGASRLLLRARSKDGRR